MYSPPLHVHPPLHIQRWLFETQLSVQHKALAIVAESPPGTPTAAEHWFCIYFASFSKHQCCHVTHTGWNGTSQASLQPALAARGPGSAAVINIQRFAVMTRLFLGGSNKLTVQQRRRPGHCCRRPPRPPCPGIAGSGDQAPTAPGPLTDRPLCSGLCTARLALQSVFSSQVRS